MKAEQKKEQQVMLHWLLITCVYVFTTKLSAVGCLALSCQIWLKRARTSARARSHCALCAFALTHLLLWICSVRRPTIIDSLEIYSSLQCDASPCFCSWCKNLQKSRFMLHHFFVPHHRYRCRRRHLIKAALTRLFSDESFDCVWHE